MAVPLQFAQHSSMATGHHQRGVTLLVVMVMLVVIGLVSASAMRQAANADLISNNARLEHLAKQKAETALRFCENSLIKDPATPAAPIQPSSTTAPAWKNFDNWHGSAKTAVDLSTNDHQSSDQTAAGPNKAPQCMIEYSPLGNTIYIVTARGFSPDFREDGDGRTETGAVVWLQSTLSLQ